MTTNKERLRLPNNLVCCLEFMATHPGCNHWELETLLRTLPRIRSTSVAAIVLWMRARALTAAYGTAKGAQAIEFLDVAAGYVTYTLDQTPMENTTLRNSFRELLCKLHKEKAAFLVIRDNNGDGPLCHCGLETCDGGRYQIHLQYVQSVWSDGLEDMSDETYETSLKRLVEKMCALSEEDSFTDLSEEDLSKRRECSAHFFKDMKELFDDVCSDDLEGSRFLQHAGRFYDAVARYYCRRNCRMDFVKTIALSHITGSFDKGFVPDEGLMARLRDMCQHIKRELVRRAQDAPLEKQAQLDDLLHYCFNDFGGVFQTLVTLWDVFGDARGELHSGGPNVLSLKAASYR